MLKEEVESSYAPERIIELQSNEVDDMQKNMDIVAERLKNFVEIKKLERRQKQLWFKSTWASVWDWVQF